MENLDQAPHSLTQEAGEKYNHAWFVERAMGSVHKIADNTWDYSDSLLLYMPSGVVEYEAVQNTDTPYHRLVTAPEHEYLQQVASDIVSELPDVFDYIDLGPGAEHKEQFFFDACKAQGKTFTYFPVDISEHFLNLAQTYAEAQNIETKTLKGSFEELPDVLGVSQKPRFVSLGLTFSNYNPAHITNLLKQIAGKNGFIFINAQMRDRTDMLQLRAIYEQAVSPLCLDKLQLLGLTIDKHVSVPFVDENNQAWCYVLEMSTQLEQLGIKKGDKILLFQSLRYTPETLETNIKESEATYKMYDIGSSFIASLIKT
ncbi:MAG: L-histidine N(alpha)-methyltransferase [Minisyncoccia bacterium]